MRLECSNDGLWIYPESKQDEAYIRDTLKISEGKPIKLYLVESIGRDDDYERWDVLTTEKPREEK
jgi:hypothetical protein